MRNTEYTYRSNAATLPDFPEGYRSGTIEKKVSWRRYWIEYRVLRYLFSDIDVRLRAMNFCLAGSTSSLGQCIFRYLENLLLVLSISLVAHCVSTLPVLLKSAAQILKSVETMSPLERFEYWEGRISLSIVLSSDTAISSLCQLLR